MSELSGKTVAELRELAREREVASRTEINRARKATLLEWLEAPKHTLLSIACRHHTTARSSKCINAVDNYHHDYHRQRC